MRIDTAIKPSDRPLQSNDRRPFSLFASKRENSLPSQTEEEARSARSVSRSSWASSSVASRMFVRSGRLFEKLSSDFPTSTGSLPVLVAGRKSSRRIQTVSLRLPASFSICQRPASVEIGPPPFRVEARQLKRWRVEPPDWAAFLRQLDYIRRSPFSRAICSDQPARHSAPQMGQSRTNLNLNSNFRIFEYSQTCASFLVDLFIPKMNAEGERRGFSTSTCKRLMEVEVRLASSLKLSKL